MRTLRGLQVAAFDADGQIGHLLQYYGERDREGRLLPDQNPMTGVKSFDLHRTEERGLLVDALDIGASTMIFDFPAGPLGYLNEAIGGSNKIDSLIDEYTRDDVKITVAIVISNIQSSAHNVTAAMEVFRNKVDYVVVKNLFYGKPSDFLFFDGFTGADGHLYGGQAKEALSRRYGKTIEMPALPGREYALCDLYSLGFSEAKNHKALRRSERAAIEIFLNEFGAAVDNVAPLFGYEVDLNEENPFASLLGVKSTRQSPF